jgi:hypothetical protein
MLTYYANWTIQGAIDSSSFSSTVGDERSMTMKHNVGGLDRLFRLGIGVPSLVVAFVTDDLLLKFVFGLVAVVGLLTAAIGYCPINDKLNRNTAEKKK